MYMYIARIDVNVPITPSSNAACYSDFLLILYSDMIELKSMEMLTPLSYHRGSNYRHSRVTDPVHLQVASAT